LLAGLPWGRSPRNFSHQSYSEQCMSCVPARPTCRSVLGYAIQTILAELPNEPFSSTLQEIINRSRCYFILLTPIHYSATLICQHLIVQVLPLL
jgi:hypothetical protein